MVTCNEKLLFLGLEGKDWGEGRTFSWAWEQPEGSPFCPHSLFLFFCFVCAWLLQELGELLLQLPWETTAVELCQSRRQATHLAWTVVFWGIIQTKENTVHLMALIKEFLTFLVQTGSVLRCSQSELGPSCVARRSMLPCLLH